MKSILLLVWLGAPLALHSATPFGVTAWTVDDGLPQNIVRGLHQTPDGYLWIATLDGLARFDGVRFTVFDRNTTPEIKSGRFAALYGSPTGDLWLSTDGSGLTRYHKGRFITYTQRDCLPVDAVRCVTGDGAGNVWALAADAILKWNETTGRFTDVTPPDRRLRYDWALWEGGGFWGADRNGVHFFVAGRFLDYPPPPGMMPESIWGAARDQSGAVFVETIQGRQVKYTPEHGWSPVDSESAAATLYRDGRGQVWEFGIQRRLVRYIHAPAPGGGRIPFSALLEDRERNLWLGAEGQGLYQLRRQFIRTYSVEDGLSHRNVYQVAKDAEGSIWIGAWDGSLSRFRNGCFATFGAADGLPGTAITALFPDRDGTLWVGCNEELRVFDGYRFRKPAAPQVPARATVNAVFRARDGALWMGLSRGLLRYSGGESKLFTVADGLAANDVRVIVESAGGGLWMGGYGGLARFEDGRFRPCAACAGLGGENIRALYEDADGTLWIGTYDGGLGRLKSGKLTRYTVRSGLFSNGAFQILEDSRGNLWMSSNRGIYRAAKRELTDFAEGRRDAVTTAGYARVDGMKNVECNGGYAPAGTVAPDGSLWFPTQDGVAVIDPEKAPRNLTPPPVLIESVLLDRHPVPFDRPVRVPPGAQSIEIQYTALSFIKPELVRFRYRLAELDSAWNEAGRRRTAFYSHVPPGHYVFEVTALSSDGVWNTAGRRLEISVAAPFYRTWQFEALLTLCAAGAVAFAWKWRVAPFERRQAEQRAFSRQLIDSQENERKRIAAELHDSIGQRLVVVKNLAMLFLRRQGQDDAAGGKFAAIEEISSEAGLAIAETREISYNLRPFQLDRLGLTKAVEALVRTASAASQTHFTTELETIDDALPEESRISFYPIVQECLNNIVKHSGASEAKVSIGRAGGQVVMSISDNGRGFLAGAKVSAGSKSGFGLTGMAERASLLGGSFEIRSTPGNGTVATVTIKTGGQRL